MSLNLTSPTDSSQVKFVYLSSDSYKSINEKDQNTIYFVGDQDGTGKVFVGDKSFSDDPHFNTFDGVIDTTSNIYSPGRYFGVYSHDPESHDNILFGSSELFNVLTYLFMDSEDYAYILEMEVKRGKVEVDAKEADILLYTMTITAGGAEVDPTRKYVFTNFSLGDASLDCTLWTMSYPRALPCHVRSIASSVASMLYDADISNVFFELKGNTLRGFAYKSSDTVYINADQYSESPLTYQRHVIGRYNGSLNPAWVEESNASPYDSTPSAATSSGASGSSDFYARGDHSHPAQTTVSGNAGTATTLQNARTIDGVSFNGGSNVIHVTTSTSSAITATKQLINASFRSTTPSDGDIVYARFANTNTADSSDLKLAVKSGSSVSDSSVEKPIKRGGQTITENLISGRVYQFMYSSVSDSWEMLTTYETGESVPEYLRCDDLTSSDNIDELYGDVIPLVTGTSNLRKKTFTIFSPGEQPEGTYPIDTTVESGNSPLPTPFIGGSQILTLEVTVRGNLVTTLRTIQKITNDKGVEFTRYINNDGTCGEWVQTYPAISATIVRYEDSTSTSDSPSGK